MGTTLKNITLSIIAVIGTGRNYIMSQTYTHHHFEKKKGRCFHYDILLNTFLKVFIFVSILALYISCKKIYIERTWTLHEWDVLQFL